MTSGRPSRALERRNLVIDVMNEWGYISGREAIAAHSEPLGAQPIPYLAGSAPEYSSCEY